MELMKKQNDITKGVPYYLCYFFTYSVQENIHDYSNH